MEDIYSINKFLTEFPFAQILMINIQAEVIYSSITEGYNLILDIFSIGYLIYMDWISLFSVLG